MQTRAFRKPLRSTFRWDRGCSLVRTRWSTRQCLRSMPQISDERTWIENPVTLGSIQIKGDGAGLNRDSDWNGYDGEPLNKLWDTHTDVFGNGQFLAGGGGLSYRVRYL